jgi:hypothetical protein
LRRARARDDARSRDVGERLRDHRLVAVCRRRRPARRRASSRVYFAPRLVVKTRVSPSRRRDRRRRLRRVIVRCVIQDGVSCRGFIVRALSRVARRSSRIVLDIKPMYYARRARGRRHRIRR